MKNYYCRAKYLNLIKEMLDKKEILLLLQKQFIILNLTVNKYLIIILIGM